MFYFQQLFLQALSGIDKTSIVPSMVNIGYVIVLIGFLVGLYQALLHGGDMRALVATAVKYLVIGLLLANWSSVFRDVNSAANVLAEAIANATDAGDMFSSWLTQLKQQYDANGNQEILKMLTMTPAALTSVLSIIAAYVIYPVAMLLFSFFYTLYGVILYVVGPLVLALLPITGVNQLSKSFAVNVMIWNAWGILYAILGDLITAVNANQVSNLLNQGFLGFFHGLADANLLGMVSIVYALAIAFIPYIASRVFSGEVGDTMFSVIEAAKTAMVLAFSAGAGLESAAAGGGASGGAGQGAASSSSSAAAAGGANGSSANSASSSSSAPKEAGVGRQYRDALKNAAGQGDRAVAGSGAEGAGGKGAAGKSDSSGKGGTSSNGGGGKSGSGGSGSSRTPHEKDYSFRPRGVAQFVAFHAGRAAGKALNNAQRTSTSGSKDSANEKKS